MLEQWMGIEPEEIVVGDFEQVRPFEADDAGELAQPRPRSVAGQERDSQPSWEWRH